MFAGYLAKKLKVAIITINDEISKLFNKLGLTIIEKDGKALKVKPRAIPFSQIEDANSNYSILAVKAYHVENIAKALAKKKRNFVLLTLQNGFRIKERILNHYPKVVTGLTYQASTFIEFGKVIHAANGPTLIEDCEYGREFEKMLNLCGLSAKIVSDINYEVWRKLVVNCAINPLSCITGLKNGELIKNELISNVMKKVIGEAINVANSLGININYDEMVNYTWHVAEVTSNNKSSMLQDVEKGRTTEIDFINGEIVNMGKSIGKKVIFNEIICNLVHEVEKGNKISLNDLFKRICEMKDV